MVVEAVVFDVSDTLVNLYSGIAAAGVADAIDELRAAGVQVIGIGNHTSAQLARHVQRAGIALDLTVGLDMTGGKKKGSSEWGKQLQTITGLSPNQFLMVGDQHLDMVTATWPGFVYAHAAWVRPAGQYGLVAPSPKWVTAVVNNIFRKVHPWYWSLNTADRAGRQVRVRTLLEAGGNNSDALRANIIALFKSGWDTAVGPVRLSEFVMLHMLASVYDTNLLGDVDYWTTYPGHDGQPNSVMGAFLDVATKLFRKRYAGDLFDRHALALRSRDAWARGGAVGARANQLNTIRINDKYRGKLAGKRILVLDNFLTRGYSTETARNLLLSGGCAEVIIACVGKYGRYMHVVGAPPGRTWDPYTTSPPDPAAFSDVEMPGSYDPDAMVEFRASYRTMASMI